MSAGPQIRETHDSGSTAIVPRWMLPAILAAAIAALWPSLRGGLVWEDLDLVGRNPWIASFAHLPEILFRPTWGFAGSSGNGEWRPLTSVALFIAHRLGGGDPIWFHALSLAFHLAATAVAFRLARRLSGSALVAFFASLLFALHPVHVESVAWISAIADPLCGFFVLLAVDAFVAWRDRARDFVGDVAAARPPWRSAVFFACALFAKESGVVALAIAVAIDLARGEFHAQPLASGVPASRSESARGAHGAMRAYVPLLAALALCYVARAFVFADPRAGLDRSLVNFGVPVSRLLLLRVELLGGFVGLLAWPFKLNLFRSFQPGRVLADPVVLAALAWIAALALVIWRARARRATLMLCAAAIIAAAIVPLLIRVETLGRYPLADRYLYVAVLGFALLATSVALRFLPKAAAIACLALLALVYGVRSFHRTEFWHDEEHLFTIAAADAPKDPFVALSLGRVMLAKYRAENTGDTLMRSHAAYQRSLDLLKTAQDGDQTIFATVDDHVQANLGFGWTFLYEAEVDEEHEFKAASEVFKMVADRYPLSAEAWTSLGVASSQMNETDDAQRDFEKALSIDPAHAEAYRGMGVLALRQGDLEKAAANFEKALALRPDSLDDALSLAGALGDGGDMSRAVAVAEDARDKHPREAAPLALLGTLAAQRGDLAAAASYAERALAIAPDDGKSLLLKGKLQLARQEYAGALRTYQRAADLLPTSFEAHHNAAMLLLKTQGFEAAVPYLLRAYEHRPTGPHVAAGNVLRETLVKMDIRDAELLWKLAAIDAQHGRDTDAEDWLARVLALKPDHGPAHFLKGSLARKHGDREAAIGEWKQASAAMPDSAAVNEALGMLLVELKRPAEALPFLESALAIATREPTSDETEQRAIEMLRATIERVKKDAH